MAGRSGFGSTATMIVTNTLAKDLAYTNFAYCSPSDLWSFSVSGSKLAFALVGDSFVLSVSAHESIPNGHIALNAIQRRHAKVSTGDTVSVSRFIPPDDFNLALLTLELEFVKKGMKDEQVDAVLLAQQIRKRFINQVMTTGQRVTIEYHGNGYIFTVNQAGVEGQVKSNSMDSIVNQLLTKIDGVESLNNVLLIGMTNRKDLLDEALLRPGRLEVQVEISLPDEPGRLQILQIHTNKMKENSFLAPDVNLQELAARTKNYSGAELEGVVKSAVSYALNRQLNMDDLTKPVDEESIKVTMEDFLNAVSEVRPAFGASTTDLDRCRLNGMMDCGARHDHIYKRTMLLAEQVRVSKGSPLVTCLLEGPSGSGKTAMAATVGIDSDFPYVKIISAESMIGLSESSKCAQIVKVFEDAYKSPLSIIILDDIERLLEYVAIGPRFSNIISQTLLVLLKRLPPKGKNVLVIGTTSEVGFLDSVGICDSFSITYHLPKLKTEDARKVLQQLNVFSKDDVDAAAEALNDMPIKKLFMVVEMAAQGEHGGGAEAIYEGKARINISHFYDCLQDIVRY